MIEHLIPWIYDAYYDEENDHIILCEWDNDNPIAYIKESPNGYILKYMYDDEKWEATFNLYNEIESFLEDLHSGNTKPIGKKIEYQWFPAGGPEVLREKGNRFFVLP